MTIYQLASLRSDARIPLHPIKALDAARATLNAALREEGESLASAYEAVKAGGASSAEAASSLRSAQAAHARSNAAAGEVRALKAQADRSALCAGAQTEHAEAPRVRDRA